MRFLFTLLLLSASLNAQQKPAPTPDALFRAAIADLQAKHFTEAEAGFRHVYELEPDNLRGLVGIAQVAMAQGQTDQAIDLVRAESAKAPARADFHVIIGDLEDQVNRHNQALTEYQQALTLMDTKTASDLRIPRGRDPVSSLTSPEILPKGAAGIYLRIAAIQLLTGDAKSALAALQKADELAPKNPLILANLAIAIEGTGDKKAAVDAYRAALAVNPRMPVALNNLAFLITETGGDLYEALRLARTAKQLAPDLDEITDTVGWVSLKLGWTDEAIDILSGLLRKQPASESGRAHLAAALEQKHGRTAAENDLKTALQAKPTPENQKAVTELLNRSYRPK